ncbi:endonuclease domain-containing protein [Sphingomonas sp. Leaf17]|uniref:endonuclease domain-containing protein n=1 Tax=Sphingomonas sp. Leaf17 TaxID=1735683 RepID=UPI001F2CBFD8|nr:endonuclease domain-containing protein [Sphingomonas sp. Leaf17]
MTLPKVVSWERLRAYRAGFKVRRQHPVGPYLYDFFCREAALAIEIDGEGHGRGDRPERDIVRDQFFEQNGFRVLRLAAGDVLRDVDAVVTRIVSCAAHPLHQPAAGPPPRAGEE